MSLLRRIGRRLRYLFRRGLTDAEMAEEMRFHLEERTADYLADGLAADDARYAAQRKFGNLGSLQEQAREARGWGWLERLGNDLRLAAHQLVRSPGFSLTAIITLALGIGANTAMFSAFNGVLLRPLPYPRVEDVFRIYRVTPQNEQGALAAADFAELLRAAGRVGEVAAYSVHSASLAREGQPTVFAYTGRCTENFLASLGVQVAFGRDFRVGEGSPGQDRVVILSQRAWQNWFGGQRDVIGRNARIDGVMHEVVGILPAGFNDYRHLGAVDFFRPLALTPEQRQDRQRHFLRPHLRLASGVTPAEATALVANVGARLAAEFPSVNADAVWRAMPLQEAVQLRNGPPMMTLLIGLSGFVLLIACSNLANLLLARTIARARELAVRAALGATRLQLLRPLLAEALLLSFVGGALGVLVALWFRDWAAFRSTGDNGERVMLPIDWNVMGWAFGAAVVTAVAFSLAPALFALRLDPNRTLKSGGRGMTAGPSQQQFGRVLIVGQFALAMVLLTGAGMFFCGLQELNERRSGWDSRQLVTGTMLLPAGKFTDNEKIAAFQRLALEQVAQLPGVATASLATFSPFQEWTDVRKFVAEGRSGQQLGAVPAAVNVVSNHYFDTLGTRLLAGRGFDERDRESSMPVFVLGETAARVLFGKENPLGRRLAQGDGESREWGEVVGVVSDVEPVVADTKPVMVQIYRPIAQEPRRLLEIAVRLESGAPAVAESLRAALVALEPDLALRHVQPADERVMRANYQLSFLRDILIVIALLGLGLAALGVYGVVARMMAHRTTEFAIRLALGAGVPDLTRLVLTSGVKLSLVGSAFGVLGAWGVAQVVAAGFPGMRSAGASVVLGAMLGLIAVALLACWLPARRVGRVDALGVLRAE